MLKQNVKNQDVVFNRKDVRKLAISLLDEIFNTGKTDWPEKHFDSKYECSYIFDFVVITNDAQSKIFYSFSLHFMFIF